MLGTLHILYDNFWLLYFATVEFNQRSQKIDILFGWKYYFGIWQANASRGAARIWHRRVYSDWPTTGSTAPGAESDIYDYLVAGWVESRDSEGGGGATTWPSRHLLMTGAPVWWRAAPRRYKQINSSRTRRSVGELSAARTTADSTACWLHCTFTSTRTGRLSTGPWKHDPLISADKKLCSWSYAH